MQKRGRVFKKLFKNFLQTVFKNSLGKVVIMMVFGIKDWFCEVKVTLF